MTNLTANEIEKEQTQNEVKSYETDQCENGVAIAHNLAVTLACAKETIDEPRLPAQLSRHPTHRVRNVGKRKREHQNPKQECALLESSAPTLKSCNRHQQYEQTTECNHQVKRVVQQFDIVRPLVLRKFV